MREIFGIGLGVATLALVACGGGVNAVQTMEPDGSHGIAISCRLGSPWRCMDEIAAWCPRGYTALNAPAPTGNHTSASPNLVQEGPHWTIRVKCGAPRHPATVKEEPAVTSDDVCKKDPMMRTDAEANVRCSSPADTAP